MLKVRLSRISLLCAILGLVGLLAAIPAQAGVAPIVPHIIYWNGNIATWANGAPWIKLMTRDDIVRARSAGAVRIYYRPYEVPGRDDGQCNDGAAMANAVLSLLSTVPTNQWPDAIGYRNEFCDTSPTPQQFIPYYDTLRAGGYNGMIIYGSYSVGWPGETDWGLPQLIAAANKADGIETHQYFDLTVAFDDTWLCRREVRDMGNYPYLLGKPWFIGEFASGPSWCPQEDSQCRGGWSDRSKLSVGQYTDQMTLYRANAADQVKAIFVFTDGDNGGWPGYPVCGTGVGDWMKNNTWTATSAIKGVVKDSASNPILHATVATTTGGYTCTTNSAGRYFLLNVAPGTYSVTASKSGYNSSTNSGVSASVNAYTTSNFTLGGTSTGTISGWVKTTGGTAISGATVRTDNGGYSTTTDGSGNYTLSNVSVGTYNVTGAKSGYDPVTNTGVSVTANNTTTSNINLPVSNDAGTGGDAGNTFAAATTISAGSYNGAVDITTDTDDYYKFSVTSGQVITCSMTPPSGSDFDIFLYNPSGTQKASSEASGSATENISFTADATGTWSLRVFAYAGSGTYSFTVGLSTSGMNNNTPTGTNYAPNSTQWPTDSNYSSSFDGSKAIDGLNTGSSKWCTTNTAAPHWLALDLGQDRLVNGFIVRLAGGEGEYTTENIKNFQIQSSTSINGTWTDECVVDNTAQANTVTRSYITPKTLRYVRLYITNTGIDNYARVPEFEVWCGACSNPTITTQPQSLTVNVGDAASFSVTATNATSYQWKKGGSNISGATASEYTITSVVSGDAGSYTVAVTNSCGTVTSNAATLTVNGGVGSLTGYVQDLLGNGISGATVQTNTGGYSTTTASNGTYTISNVVAGTYNVTASMTYYVSKTNNGAVVTSGNATTSNFNLQNTMNTNTPTGTNNAPQSTTVNADTYYGSGFEGSKAVDGSTTTKWCTTGAAPPHWLALDLGQNRVVNGFVVKFPGGCGENTYYNAKNFSIQSASSISGPWSDEVVVDNTAQANTVSRTYDQSKTLRYVRLYITNAGIDNYTRLYEFEVWCGTCSVPSITTQPSSMTRNVGESATFSLSATGATSYQWKKAGNNISGATGASYTISSVVTGDAGNYTCVVTNACGSVTSNTATLTVNTGGIASESFTTLPSWTSTFDATWGSAATFSSVSGGQSGNQMQASRSSNGSSEKVKVYTVPTSTNITISIYIKAPSYGGGTYWVETSYKMGSNSAQDFDTNAGTWSPIQNFSNTGTNGNGGTWTLYTATLNTGASTQISIGYKHGAQYCVGPTIGWDTFAIN